MNSESQSESDKPSQNLGLSDDRPEIPLGVRAYANIPLMHILECCEKLLAKKDEEKDGPAGLEKIQSAAQQLLLWLNAPEGQTEYFRKNPDNKKLQSLLTDPLPKPAARSGTGELLVVDDNHQNRDILKLLLTQQGYNVKLAEGGVAALETVRSSNFDLVLLDILMPGMDGYHVLRTIKADPQLKHLPIIMISGLDQIENVIRCIELGAEDFVPKPFNPVLLRAKIDACLEKKRLRDQDRAHLLRLRAEQEKSESLLLNILPKPIADRLKTGENTIVDYFSDVTVLFADLVDFTQLSSHLSPTEVVRSLNEIFSEFDRLVDHLQVEKIKTVGDAYMAVAGLPRKRDDHAPVMVQLGLRMNESIQKINAERGTNLQLRIGIASGPVIAGIIGRRKFIYDLWGDTVNSASRMESQGAPGEIQITETTYQKVHTLFSCKHRGRIEIKGKGEMQTYLVQKSA
jgi:class 3 adenylate cyclase